VKRGGSKTTITLARRKIAEIKARDDEPEEERERERVLPRD